MSSARPQSCSRPKSLALLQARRRAQPRVPQEGGECFPATAQPSRGIRFNPAEAGGDASATPKPAREKPAPRPPTPPATLCLSSVRRWGDRQLSQALGMDSPGRAEAPLSHQRRRANFSRLDAFLGSAPHCPVAVPIPGAARSFLRTAAWVPSILRGGAEHPAPLQDAQALPPPRPLRVRSRKASDTESPGPHPAGSTALLPAQPFPAGSHPPQRVRQGRA